MPIDDEFLLDLDRAHRTGLAEAILCEGKSSEQLLAICARIAVLDQPMLLTRLSQATHALLEATHPGLLDYDPVSRTACVRALPLSGEARIAIVTGGTGDVPVAREAARTLACYGEPSTAITDIGVAGLWRVTSRLEEIRRHRVIIAVAGMDAALPTVLGGLVGRPLIAVPTSVGYGITRGGETALHALLASCAPGLTVVNIDNGYGAACAALRILHLPTGSGPG